MTEELKPCPFCGGEARGAHEDYGDTHYWRVYCDTIGCAFGMSKVFHSEAEAIAAWNARVGSHCAFAQPTDLTDGCALLTERTCEMEYRELEQLVRDMQALDRMHHGPFSWERFDKMQDMRGSINARLIKMGFVEEVGE